MRNLLQLLITLCITSIGWSQQLPVNCDLAVPGCTTPSFPVTGTNPSYDIEDFTTGSISNPSSNPNGSNAGCLLSGETVSTFITINIVTSGVFEWSLIGLDGSGNPSNSGCFDWIMWPNVAGNACTGINGNTLPPVACNWNGSCNANTGMANPSNYPPGASSTSYESPLTVTAGQSFVLCLSNYSFTAQNVNLDFFGSAQVSCGADAPDQTICEGSSATVTINTSGLPSPEFEWLVTTGVSDPSSGTNVMVTPTVTTTYLVEVYQAPFGANPAYLDTAEFTITVAPLPDPNAGPDQNICLGQPILLNGTIGSSTNTPSWQAIVPPGLLPPATASFSPSFSSLTPTVTVNQPGTYYFILRESSTLCGIGRDTVVVVVSELFVSASKVNPACFGYNDGQITITSVGATEYSFDNGVTWQTSATQGGFTVGTYDVCARNAFGCEKCTTITLTQPVEVVASVSPNVSICLTKETEIYASATGGTSFTYDWDFTSSTLDTQLVSPVSTTTYTVVAVNQIGCMSQPKTVTVTIMPLPIPQISVDEPLKCEPALFTLTNTTDPTMSASTFWLINGEDFINVNTVQPIALYAGNYDVQLIVVSPDGCIDSTTFVQFLHVQPKPNARFNWNPNPVMMFDTEVRFINSSTDADSFEWFFENGIPSNSILEHPTAIFPDGIIDNYDVTLIATSDLGCTDTAIYQVVVYPEVILYAPNAFTPNGDEFNHTWQVFMEGIDIYEFELLMFDRWGEIVWESHDITAKWDGSYKGKIMPTGTYQWTIRTKDALNDKKHTFKGSVSILK